MAEGATMTAMARDGHHTREADGKANQQRISHHRSRPSTVRAQYPRQAAKQDATEEKREHNGGRETTRQEKTKEDKQAKRREGGKGID